MKVRRRGAVRATLAKPRGESVFKTDVHVSPEGSNRAGGEGTHRPVPSATRYRRLMRGLTTSFFARGKEGGRERASHSLNKAWGAHNANPKSPMTAKATTPQSKSGVFQNKNVKGRQGARRGRGGRKATHKKEGRKRSRPRPPVEGNAGATTPRKGANRWCRPLTPRRRGVKISAETLLWRFPSCSWQQRTSSSSFLFPFHSREDERREQ